MKISIVTISFNQAPFLERAIRSVIDQDHPDIEYVVVDPGSVDGSREIIERYRSRFAKIILEADAGPADGLNRGFAEASGEVFGFLNADDELEPGALSRIARFFEKHSDTDVVSGHSWIVDADDNIRRGFLSDRFSLRMAAYGASILCQASTFFRAEAFRRTNGFNVENRLTWDAELFVDMALAGARFCTVPEYWSRFRIHGESITGSGKHSAAHELIGRGCSGRRLVEIRIPWILYFWLVPESPERFSTRATRFNGYVTAPFTGKLSEASATILFSALQT